MNDSIERGFLRRVPDFSRDGFDIDTGQINISGGNASFGNWNGDALRGFQDLDQGAGDDRDLSALKAVHSQAREGFAGMVDTLRAVGADKSDGLDNNGRLRIAARLLEPKLQSLADAAQREDARAASAVAEELAEIERAAKPRDQGEATLHGEIRRHWAAMSSEARAKALRGDMDADTLRALGSAPAYLSGLSAQEHAMVHEAMAKQVAPDRQDRITRLEQGRVLASIAIETYTRRATRLVDFAKARRMAEAEAAERARQAEKYGG